MNPALVTLSAFLFGALALVGVYSVMADLFLRDRSRVGQRLDDEFRKRQRERVSKSALFRNLGDRAAEIMEATTEPTIRERFEAMVEQSGLEVSPQRVLLLCLVLAAGFGGLAMLIQGRVSVTIIAGLVGAALPIVYVYFKWSARMKKLLSQLPEAFDLMARIMRSGQTMSQALQGVADEFEPPIAVEFAYCYEQQNLGLPPELAFRDLARRTGLLEIKIFVLAMLVQQQTGGNIAEMLDRLAGVVRDRLKMKSKIQALTAEGRLQAVVLLALPPAMLVMLLILNPSYGRILLQHPPLLIGMFTFEFIGALWIRKIVNFDF